jgi:hypothetical protein
MRSYLSGRAGCLYRQAAGSWNVLDTLGDVIICNHLSATRRFRHVPEPSMGFHEVPWGSMRFRGIPWASVGFHELPSDSMRFHGIPWSSMRFYDVPVNRSVPTEANRGLTSYIGQASHQAKRHVNQHGTRSKSVSASGSMCKINTWSQSFTTSHLHQYTR